MAPEGSIITEGAGAARGGGDIERSKKALNSRLELPEQYARQISPVLGGWRTRTPCRGLYERWSGPGKELLSVLVRAHATVVYFSSIHYVRISLAYCLVKFGTFASPDQTRRTPLRYAAPLVARNTAKHSLPTAPLAFGPPNDARSPALLPGIEGALLRPTTLVFLPYTTSPLALSPVRLATFTSCPPVSPFLVRSSGLAPRRP